MSLNHLLIEYTVIKRTSTFSIKGPTDPSKVINNRLYILKLSMVTIVDRKVETQDSLHIYIHTRGPKKYIIYIIYIFRLGTLFHGTY